MILADLGADVIKIERPGQGDLARQNGPFKDGHSMYFQSMNRGKRGITLNLQHAKGKEIFLRLVKKSDIVLQNFRVGTMKKLGLDYPVLREHNPRIIYVSISGFGQTGPYAEKTAFDIIVQGMGGMLSVTGEPGGPPIRPGASLGDTICSLFSVAGILAALYERERSGEGQELDMAMLDCQVAILENAVSRYLATGEVPKPTGSRHPIATPFQAFQTRDGYIVVAMMGREDVLWPRFCKLIGHEELLQDKRFDTNFSRIQHLDILEPVFREAMLKKTTTEWLDTLTAADIPCGPVNTIDKVVKDPHIEHRGMITEVQHSSLGKLRTHNTPLKLSRTPARVDKAAPELGEHTEEVLRELLGVSRRQLNALRKDSVI
jgi:CoA:oxalate CoA-transferase